MKLFIHFILIGTILFFQNICTLAVSHAEVNIIANPSVEADSMSYALLKDIYMGEMIRWQNGKKIKIVMMNARNDIHKEFVKKIIKMPTIRFLRHWRRLLFLGKNIAPIIINTDEGVISYVSQNKNAIGYVFSKPQTNSVKVIAILAKQDKK